MKSRKQLAAEFKAAKKKLATTRHEWVSRKKEEFICHSLTSQQAKEIIRVRMNHSGSLNHWLVQNVPSALKLANKNNVEFEEQVQEYRHRWLDALIEEFSE